MIELDSITREEFEGCLHEIFWIIAVDGKFPLKLSEVLGAGAPLPGVKRAPFSVTFQAAQPIRIPQSIYRLEHERLGLMEIFLVPISLTEMQAVFS